MYCRHIFNGFLINLKYHCHNIDKISWVIIFEIYFFLKNFFWIFLTAEINMLHVSQSKPIQELNHDENPFIVNITYISFKRNISK